MFDGRDFPKPLDEQVFNSWLEKGRSSLIGYKYLIVIWDSYESEYQPVFIATREEIDRFDRSSISRERLVAVYDLYSESRLA